MTCVLPEFPDGNIWNTFLRATEAGYDVTLTNRQAREVLSERALLIEKNNELLRTHELSGQCAVGDGTSS